MTGSEKQIEWAEKIRAEKLAEVPAFRVKLDAMKAQSKGTPEQIAAMSALMEKAMATFEAEERAAYWIDNRDNSAEFLVKEIARSLRG